jgi:excisionase family DNA binding protein
VNKWLERYLLDKHGGVTGNVTQGERDMKKENKKKVYTVLEASEMLGVAKATVYKAIHKGDIPAIKVAGSYVIPRRHFDSLLNGEYVRLSKELKDLCRKIIENPNAKAKDVLDEWSDEAYYGREM